MSALKWQGWAVGLTVVAGLLVFAPLGLYVWASGEPGAAPPRPAVEDVRVTGCRIDPGSRRVVATVEVAGRPEGTGAYVVTVEFREKADPDPDAAARPAQSLVKLPGVAPSATEHAEALGPLWPPATTPWCGVAAADFTPNR
ncbi:hypothetical protein AB0C90_26095 [Streptomyces sp. NPDC048550]|uniref:hypothetical protein n=1 Tax=unclassified Streptomyces TaxID=2593676 RepID=UPI00225A2E36|nr:hypothetical protein [Streptomyces sp. NBC_00320]MCX5145755.1 hypothetical protein [Streptomyces sp. NBC_00320]WSW61579.1 hypothetical protein OG513_25045 [Streptomyces sp. NBC_00998]